MYRVVIVFPGEQVIIRGGFLTSATAAEFMLKACASAEMDGRIFDTEIVSASIYRTGQ